MHISDREVIISVLNNITVIVMCTLNYGSLIFRSQDVANFSDGFWEIVMPSLFLVATIIIVVKSACCGYKCRDDWTFRDCLKRDVSVKATGAADGTSGAAEMANRALV